MVAHGRIIRGHNISPYGYVSPTLKAGWTIDVEKQGEGEDSKVTSITWSNGSIGEGFRDEFTFSAQVPEKSTDLSWKAYQTYSDGTVVAWDQKEEKEGVENSGPYSVTKVVAKTEAETLLANAGSEAKTAKNSADVSLYVAIASLVAAGAAIYLVVRKR